jgi:hypothetical protein
MSPMCGLVANIGLLRFKEVLQSAQGHSTSPKTSWDLQKLVIWLLNSLSIWVIGTMIRNHGSKLIGV